MQKKIKASLGGEPEELGSRILLQLNLEIQIYVLAQGEVIIKSIFTHHMPLHKFLLTIRQTLLQSKMKAA